MRDYNQEITNIILKAKTVVLTSIEEEGFPVNRAMLTIKRNMGLDVMYFSTNTSSRKIKDFIRDRKSSLYFYNPVKFKGVYIKGVIEIIQAQEVKDYFWHEGDEQYYPFGKTDPDYTILKFTAISGAYYYGQDVCEFTIKRKQISIK